MVINDFTGMGVFEQLSKLFDNYIYNNTVNTNILYTLLVTITRPVDRLSKASRRSLTPVQAP